MYVLLTHTTLQTLESIAIRKRKCLVCSAHTLTEEVEIILRLEARSKDIFSELVELKNAKKQELFRRETLLGKFSDRLGVLYLIYCIYKMIMSSVNIIFDRDPKTDPITRAFEIGLYWLSRVTQVTVNVQFWSQLFSFVMVGVMVSTSVRGFLLLVLNVFRSVASPINSNMWVFIHVF
jgi:hypothetical protein